MALTIPKRCLLLWIILGLVGCAKPETPQPPNQPSNKEAERKSNPIPSPTTPTPKDSPKSGLGKLVPLDLTSGGLCVTMNAPAGAVVEPGKTTGVVVSKEDGFRLWIQQCDKIEDSVWGFMKQELGKEGREVVQNEDDLMIFGTNVFGEEHFYGCVKMTVGGKLHVCLASTDDPIKHFTKAQVIMMVECTRSLTQTEANKKAEVRMQKAIARFKTLGCKFSLNSLNIEGEEVSDDDLALVEDVPQIRHATISAEKLTPRGIQHLQKLPHVKSVTLEGKVVTDAWLSSMKPLRLQNLWVYETSITSAGWKLFEQWPSLETLTVRRQPVDDMALSHLKGMSKLERLTLSDTGTGDAGMKHLSSLKSLWSLELVGNPITDAGLEHLMSLKELRSLELKGTKVTQAGIQKLKKALPRCDIVYSE